MNAARHETAVKVSVSENLSEERQLVDRIVLSAPFAKSARLSDFLRYICTEAEQGRQRGISEQRIGTAVFGRRPDYDSNVDSIVRSHASRLRHRLREYFEGEGLHEVVVLTIPKGSYVPRFEARDEAASSGHEGGAGIHIVETSLPAGRDRIEAERSDLSAAVSEVRPNREHTSLLPWKIAFAAAAVIALVCGTLLLREHSLAHGTPQHVFWSAFLDPHKGRTTLVEADSGLVLLQHLTRRPVALASYLNGAYLHDVSSVDAAPEIVAAMGSRRYTPAIDTAIYEKVSHLAPTPDTSIQVRYARDLRLNELKEGNAILLGTHESNPWVELFESSMNFTFRNDLEAGTSAIVNRHPVHGEPGIYPMLHDDPNHIIYGVVAYRPNLTHTGDALIVEGGTMAGTQTASEFLLDDKHLLPFLSGIRRKDGTVPHFEVLVRSSSLAGESSRLEMVSFRTETD